MRIRLLVGLTVVAAVAASANADIIGWNCADDGDGAIVMNSITWDEPTYTLSCNGTQHWWPAHILGDFTTDTEEDPIVWVRNTVLNDGEVEPLVWTDYHINIYMNKPFTILDAYTPPDWTVSNVTQPTLQGTQWKGWVDYLGGAPINLGQWGQFDVELGFTGSISYTLELIPTPEPASLMLLAIGGLILLRRK
jgi:hypothetical protein